MTVIRKNNVYNVSKGVGGWGKRTSKAFSSVLFTEFSFLLFFDNSHVNVRLHFLFSLRTLFLICINIVAMCIFAYSFVTFKVVFLKRLLEIESKGINIFILLARKVVLFYISICVGVYISHSLDSSFLPSLLHFT